MYWSRTGNQIELIFWLLASMLWWLGGWLLTTHVFRLRSNERLIVGLATGMLWSIVLSNVLAQFFLFLPALLITAILVFCGGLVAARFSPVRPWLDKKDLRAWKQVLALICLTIFFTMIGRGLAIFDDYHNLPLVSTIAVGDVPPHFYLNPQYQLAYHYGVHLFAAGLVRMAGLFPWSALDFTKALLISLTVLLAWLWFQRVTRSAQAAYLGAFLVMFGGGTRWLILFLPPSWQLKISAQLHLLGSAAQTGPSLFKNLGRLWIIDGAGPVPFPFAYVNGIFPPLPMALGGSGAAPWLTILLLLLCYQRKWQPVPCILYALILASLALTTETAFVLLIFGIVIAISLWSWWRRSFKAALPWMWVLLPSALLAVFSGGVLTEIMNRILGNLTGQPEASIAGFTAFAIRWPPAFLSAHLGELSLTNPGKFLIALLEIGPVILVIPWVVVWAIRQYQRGRIILVALGIAIVCGLVIPLVLKYEDYERDIARVTGTALTFGMILAFPLSWFAWQKGKSWLRFIIGAAYSAACLGGVVLVAIQIIAIPKPQMSYFIDPMDTRISAQYWDKLDAGTQVLDRFPHRSVTLFGRFSLSKPDYYHSFPEWDSLISYPDPQAVARAGYAYVYMDEGWWRKLPPRLQRAYNQPCVKSVIKLTDNDEDFRWLYDVQECY